jgi:hypothetical protein
MPKLSNKESEYFRRFRKMRQVADSFVLFVCLSVRPSAWNNPARNGTILIKFYISVFPTNPSRNCSFIKIWQV